MPNLPSIPEIQRLSSAILTLRRTSSFGVGWQLQCVQCPVTQAPKQADALDTSEPQKSRVKRACMLVVVLAAGKLHTTAEVASNLAIAAAEPPCSTASSCG